jgi:hypothetical protein
MPTVEPFVEQEGPAEGTVGATRFRFGYRIEGTKDVISAVDISAEAVERAVTAGLSLLARITPDGEVVPILTSPKGIAIASTAVTTSTPIDCLVAQAVDPESLRLEEACAAELETLLARLHRSISLVENAMARIERDR